MKYKILDKPAFKIVGKIKSFTTINNENQIKIPEFWNECWQNGFSEKLESMVDKNNITGKSKVSVCTNFSADTKKFDYIIGVEHNKEVPDGYHEEFIPEAKWAIFESVGKMPHAIQEIWNKIYSEWFPSTGYEHGGGPELEVYPEGNPDDEKYLCDVWVPIKSK